MALPIPRIGLVIRYHYLWRREHEAGRDYGRYARPCVIVALRTSAESGALVATVAPITHTPPDDDRLTIQLPQAVKAHLSLDAAPSWIMLDEVNDFVWPGSDIEPRGGYGALPPKLTTAIRQRLVEAIRTSRLRSTPR